MYPGLFFYLLDMILHIALYQDFFEECPLLMPQDQKISSLIQNDLLQGSAESHAMRLLIS
jgi:hypothetical protein